MVMSNVLLSVVFERRLGTHHKLGEIVLMCCVLYSMVNKVGILLRLGFEFNYHSGNLIN